MPLPLEPDLRLEDGDHLALLEEILHLAHVDHLVVVGRIARLLSKQGKGIYAPFLYETPACLLSSHLFDDFPMPGTVLVEELRGRVPERVLRLGKFDQLLPIPGGMSRPPRVRPGPEQCASRLKMPRRHRCHVNEHVIDIRRKRIN